MTNIFSRKHKGFTLIELLVVIAVIGMLASIVLVSMGPVRARARDAKRVADIRQISQAMELCYGDSTCNGTSNDSSYKILGVTTGRLNASQTIGTYMATIPTDPGGGSAACTDGASAVETTAGQYCSITGATVSEYCIYARLSDSRVFAASEKGASYMAAIPATMSACP